MKTQIFFSVLIMIIFLFNGCLNNQSHGIQAPETPNYSVQIQLLNIDTENPMTDTKIFVRGIQLLFETDSDWQEKTSDSSGTFLFEKLVPGGWKIQIFEQDCYITTHKITIVNRDTSFALRIPQALITRERYKLPGGMKEKWFEAGICWKEPGVCATLGIWKVDSESGDEFSRLFEGDFQDGFEVVGSKVFEVENPDFSGLVWAAPNYYTFTGTLDNPQICLLDRKTGKVVGRGKAPHRLIDLAWDGEYFWGTATHSKILKFSPYSFTLKFEYPAPAQHPGGIAWDGRNLWSYDTETQWLYKHGDGMNPIRTFCLVFQDEYYENWTLNEIKYMAFDFEKNLYVLDPTGHFVYQFSIPEN